MMKYAVAASFLHLLIRQLEMSMTMMAMMIGLLLPYLFSYEVMGESREPANLCGEMLETFSLFYNHCTFLILLRGG